MDLLIGFWLTGVPQLLLFWVLATMLIYVSGEVMFDAVDILGMTDRVS